MNGVFELIHNDKDKVILKVKVDSLLTIAMYPYIQIDYAYITITKGKHHTLTVTKNDGKTFSFSWGEGGSTLIGDNLISLKKAVLNIIAENYIDLEWNYSSSPESIAVFYNPNFKKWELTTNKGTCYFSDTANSVEDMKAEVLKIYPEVIIRKWVTYTVSTGIQVWKALCLTV